jgi:hypothetical protein
MPPASVVDAVRAEADAEALDVAQGGAYRLAYVALHALIASGVVVPEAVAAEAQRERDEARAEAAKYGRTYDNLVVVSRRLEEAEAALGDAIELADEGWTYASDYFRTKWRCDERLQELRTFLARVSSEGVSSGATSERNEHG